MNNKSIIGFGSRMIRRIVVILESTDNTLLDLHNSSDPSLRTADVSPRSSPLRTAKSPSAAISDEKRLPFAGYSDPYSA